MHEEKRGAELAILEDRGLFWWNDELIPTAMFAPDSSVSGNLTIEDDGSIRLDLEGTMPGTIHPLDMLTNVGSPIDRNIQGLLSSEAKHVLLLNLSSGGGSFRMRNVPLQRYRASDCLVGEGQFPRDNKKALSFHSVIIDLAGYEDWLWLQGIEVQRDVGKLTATHKIEKDRRYKTPFGGVSIEYDLLGPNHGMRRQKELRLTETALVRITPSRRMGLEDTETYFQRVEELLILLTSADHKVDWPTLVLAGGKQRARHYFRRYRLEGKAPAAHECLITFPRIANEFGALLATFVEQRELYGPGFYLYLGSRRGMPMFVEHRFVNLIWGLEALDRSGRGTAGADEPLRKKISRIIDQISNSSDRRWLKRMLRHAEEPSLEQRLFALFSALPLPFDEAKLRTFCRECQDRRNDISHYGGLRNRDGTYDEFMRDLNTKSDALGTLYHLLLLVVIGIDSELVNFEANKSWPLSAMQRHLHEVGILQKE